jgi:small subunit ribosomal protein S11e
MAEQIEKSFQKQQIFHNTKVSATKVGKDKRWYKDVGLGFKVRSR